MLERLLSDREVEQITKRARSTLQKDRVRGCGIRFVRLGRLVRYRESDVKTYLAELPTRSSTSDDRSASGGGAFES
jgi:predicted DNA-binding transcriptional regulator AlpA